MGRFATPDDIARAILFLSDPSKADSSTATLFPSTEAGPATPAGKACA